MRSSTASGSRPPRRAKPSWSLPATTARPAATTTTLRNTPLYGQAVSGFASTPYNVAVGGTDFYYSDYNAGTPRSTRSSPPTGARASTQLPAVSIQQYIPEQPWNDSQYGLNASTNTPPTGQHLHRRRQRRRQQLPPSAASRLQLQHRRVHRHAVRLSQTLVANRNRRPSDSVRDMPDVSLFAANGDNYSYYPICATDGDCQTSGLGSNLVQIYGVGGTSASSPAFAGIMALVNQKYGRAGPGRHHPLSAQDAVPGRLPRRNQRHQLRALRNSPRHRRTASPPLRPDSAVVSGVTEGQIGTGTTPEYNAAAGYNLATGLGTIDANVLVN